MRMIFTKKMSKTALFFIAFNLLTISVIVFFAFRFVGQPKSDLPEITNNITQGNSPVELHNMSIDALRKGSYPGSEITIEETLEPGSNYQRYLTSYTSEGLKIYALLTVPNGTKPATGWPVIVFNHGYIPPAQYRTTEKYIAYTDAFSRAGYIVFRPDYRGHGNSEGAASGGYGSNAYTIDVLNAFASVQKHPDADPQRMGMWGHSMGGFITLRSMVVNKDIKAGVIWAGVVGSYEDMLSNWRRRSPFPSPSPTPGATTSARGWRATLSTEYGTPEENPTFWNSLSANSYLQNISGPVELHHGTADSDVPVDFSQKLEQQLKAVGKPAQLFTYEGDDHNISRNLRTALNRSVAFFDKHVKGNQ